MPGPSLQTTQIILLLLLLSVVALATLARKLRELDVNAIRLNIVSEPGDGYSSNER